ncbi:hypothetical protein LTR05_007761 [Lithohypha guttulata]|uniref:Uncharacterized protein n=1 Tax=Lithohypha guttulata TaxID=1690604 RepID=A0AAN7Y8T3_9EURO|nr:hypothetical protein LTR05_007761 [Lithohypha guttulata]
MSTNPFRQTNPPKDQLTRSGESRRVVLDGGRPLNTASELSLDTKIPPSSLDRHVSFASPPVDSTIPAASYPSSPESTRSPPWQSSQPATPNYRAAFQHDPFEDLGRAIEDRTIEEARTNAQGNTRGSTIAYQDPVRDTLSRFAAAPPHLHPQSSIAAHTQPGLAGRQSLDVDAFKRLLLTGERGTVTDSTATQSTYVLNDNSSSTDTISISQSSTAESSSRDTDGTPTLSPGHDRSSSHVPRNEIGTSTSAQRVPPPAPAPRRAKSVKSKPGVVMNSPATSSEPSEVIDTQEAAFKRPPTPPLSRHHSQQVSAFHTSEAIDIPTNLDRRTEHQGVNQRAPPPPLPPGRRQQSSIQRTPSDDTTPTYGNEVETAASLSSRRSSYDRPLPPVSRNSSISTKRQSLGLTNTPPIPPPRRGRGSSRTSMDSFRPSPSDVMSKDTDVENSLSRTGTTQPNVKDRSNLTSSNASSILSELANLQKEVDAARRGSGR